MRLSFLVVLATAFMLTSGCVKTTTVRHSADFARTLAKKKTIAVLPPKALAHTEDASYRRERQYDYEYYVEDRLHEILGEALLAKGYSVITPSKGVLKEKSLYTVKDKLDAQVEKRKASLYRKGLLENIDTAHRVDVEVAKFKPELAEGLEADALIFADMKETVKTTGARTRDLAVSFAMAALSGGNGHVQVAQGESARAYVGIINGEDGHVIWMNFTHDVGGSGLGKSETEKTDAKLHRLVDQLLEDFPDHAHLADAQTVLDEASDALAAK